ncbi:glycosyltransferase [Serratia marcescens]|uniref:glycosyltransferase n=1 Tax=Serratia TaxID=613 RepID=UPI00146E9A05|nr:glycosyltransferase [Serratia marcescens]NMT26972.1 glycosyltransferase family 4 protein [Serratia marcescens]
MRIGIASNGYPEKRCITENKSHDFIKFDKSNIFKYINFLNSKLLKKAPSFIFRPLIVNPSDNIDAFHFFNHTGLLKNKWVSTFETIIPRIPEVMDIHRNPDGKNNYEKNEKIEALLSAIVESNCLGILALSQSAYNIQMAMLEAYPALADSIKSKIRIVHPPQQLRVSSIADKPADSGKVKLIFVGRDFYRKGGAEIVLAVSELIESGDILADDIDVTLIGDLSKRDNYVHGEFKDDLPFYERIESLVKNLSCISHFASVPNEQVMQKFITSQIGLLPTWGDTYGYSVLEMQACGCPVMTTSVRALTEINPAESGWMIDVPCNKFKEIVISSYDDKEEIRNTIIAGIKKNIANAVADKKTISDKAQASIERIKNAHAPDAYFKLINAIYESK